MTVGRFADDLEARAARALPEPVFRYFRQGARDSVSAAEAADAWHRHRLVPRVLRDVTEVTTAARLLGRPAALPVGIAPTTLQRAAHPDGEVAMATAAASAGVPMVLSSNAGSSFEDVAATGADWWLQLYVTADRAACALCSSGPSLPAPPRWCSPPTPRSSAPSTTTAPSSGTSSIPHCCW